MEGGKDKEIEKEKIDPHHGPGVLDVFARSHNKLSAMTSTVSCRSPKALEASFTVTKFTRNACRKLWKSREIWVKSMGTAYWSNKVP